MTNYEDVLQELTLRLKAKRTEIFCGAGISFLSGNPMAIPVLHFVLEKLGLPEEEIEVVLESGLPFEGFFTLLFNRMPATGLDEFIRIFDIGTPNSNHQLLAKLVSQGYVNRVYTTNFDLHIEEALRAENVAFRVKKTQEDLGTVHRSELPELVKLHGSVDDILSIGLTLEMVGSKLNSENKKQAIRNAFEKGPADTLLVFGYSFSDVFDIMPVLKRLNGNTKTLYIVDHCMNASQTVTRLENIDPKLPNFSGYRMFVNTDRLVQALWEGTLGTPPDKNSQINFDEWRSIIEQWADKHMPDASRNALFLGLLFTEIALPKYSEKWLRECLKRLEGFGSNNVEDVRFGYAFQSLANLYRNRGLYREAIQYAQRGLRLAEHYKQLNGVIATSDTIADCLKNLKLYDQAIAYAEGALKAARISGLKNHQAFVLNTLGMIYSEMGDNKKAVSIYEESAALCMSLGNISLEAYAIGNIARSKRRLGEVEAARELYHQVIELAKNTGDLKLLFNNYANLAVIEIPTNSQELLEKALEVAHKIDDPYFIGRAQYNLAFFHLDRGEGIDAALPFARAAFSNLCPILESGHEMRNGLRDAFGLN